MYVLPPGVCCNISSQQLYYDCFTTTVPVFFTLGRLWTDIFREHWLACVTSVPFGFRDFWLCDPAKVLRPIFGVVENRGNLAQGIHQYMLLLSCA